MEDYLEKQIFVYRRSFKYYMGMSNIFSISKFICGASGLTAFAFLPLASLSLSVGVFAFLDKHYNVGEKKEVYKMGWKFYKDLQLKYKAKKISEEEIYEQERNFIQNLTYLPRECYIKKMKLNGYSN
jgi:hypothetical protein